MAAANPLRGEAPLVTPEKSYTLAYDINALILAEEASAMDIDPLLARLEKGAGLKLLRIVVWAGLQRDHECDLVAAGEIITQAGVVVARAAMTKALRAAFLPPTADNPKNPRKATDGTGSAG